MSKNKNIEPRNSKGQEHGYWECYQDGDTLSYKGHYVNGKRYGYWEQYHHAGIIWYKSNYVNGKAIGLWEMYFYNGALNYKEYYNYLGNQEGISIAHYLYIANSSKL